MDKGEFKVDDISEDGQYAYLVHTNASNNLFNSDRDFAWLRDSSSVWVKCADLLQLLNGFDTGGYTGAWGPEGRLAMLHQKEIVLNAHDTENFLSAIELVRNLSERLDLSAAA
jgi:hypothetical protein